MSLIYGVVNLRGDNIDISLFNDIKDVIIANNKHITINGNDHTLTNCQINNTGYLIIKDTLLCKKTLKHF